MKLMMTILSLLWLSGCATASYEQQRATAQGAVIGATAGAVIGAQSGHTAEGAVIGGALGAVAGSVAGERNANRRAVPAQRHYQRSVYGRGDGEYDNKDKDRGRYRYSEKDHEDD